MSKSRSTVGVSGVFLPRQRHASGKGRTMKRSVAWGLAVALIAVFATTAQAAWPLTVGAGWYDFYWGWDFPNDDSWNEGGPFTFTSDSWTVLTVTDGLVPVDQFEIYDGGVLIGTTSTPSGDEFLCANSYDEALADSNWSSGTFLLAPGDHAITIFTCLDPYFSGVGGLRVDVSESPVYTDYQVIPVDVTTGTTPVTLVFSEMLQLGETTLVTSPSGPACPSGFRMGVPATYYNLATAATYTPPIGIAIAYAGTAFSGPQANLRLLHWENDAWVDCTLAVDPESQTIFGQVSSLSPFIIVEPVLHVEIDIRPGGSHRGFYQKGCGTIPVVIFGSMDVDATRINPAGLRLAGMAVKTKYNGRPQYCLEDVNRDGHRDLVCYFVDRLPPWPLGVRPLTLTGNLSDGTPVEGADEIRIFPSFHHWWMWWWWCRH